MTFSSSGARRSEGGEVSVGKLCPASLLGALLLVVALVGARVVVVGLEAKQESGLVGLLGVEVLAVKLGVLGLGLLLHLVIVVRLLDQLVVDLLVLASFPSLDKTLLVGSLSI